MAPQVQFSSLEEGGASIPGFDEYAFKYGLG